MITSLVFGITLLSAGRAQGLVRPASQDWSFVVLPNPSEINTSIEPALKSRGFALLFEYAYPRGKYYDRNYRRQSDGQTLMFVLGQARSQLELDCMRTNITVSSGSTNRERSPSDVSLGDFCFTLADGASVHAAADGYYVRIDQPALFHEAEKDKAGDIRAIEAIARIALAECIGATLHDDGTPSGPPVATLRHPHTSYVVLSKARQAGGFKTDVGEWRDRCRILWNHHTVELALGSDYATVDDKTMPLEAFVALKKGEWIVPKAVLASIGIKGL